MPDVEHLRRAHRRLDQLLGEFLAAADAGALSSSRDAIVAFDEELRRHMAFEEESVLPQAAGHGLAPAENETPATRLGRELRVEHVQIREISGLVRRLVEQQGDVAGARRLFPNLARRWDAHTQREERELGPSA